MSTNLVLEDQLKNFSAKDGGVQILVKTTGMAAISKGGEQKRDGEEISKVEEE